jgi:hypothetical protein
LVSSIATGAGSSEIVVGVTVGIYLGADTIKKVSACVALYANTILEAMTVWTKVVDAGAIRRWTGDDDWNCQWIEDACVNICVCITIGVSIVVL